MTCRFRNLHPAPRIASRQGACHRAFTLVELVIVVALLGIAASVAIPRFGEFVTRHRADAAAARVQADLQWARQHAIVTSSPVRVVFVPDEAQYVIPQLVDPDHPGRVYTRHLAKDPVGTQLFVQLANGGDTLQFNSFGIPDQAGRIEIRIGHVTRSIQVDGVSGQVHVTTTSS